MFLISSYLGKRGDDLSQNATRSTHQIIFSEKSVGSIINTLRIGMNGESAFGAMWHYSKDQVFIAL